MTQEHQQPQDPESMLRETLTNNEAYYALLSSGTGPLMIGDLMDTARGRELSVTDDFQQIVGAIGWPGRQICEPMNRSLSFSADGGGGEAFSETLLHNHNLLNNVTTYFCIEPAKIENGRAVLKDQWSVIDYAYATAPFFMRAYMVAPELFDGLRRAFGGKTGPQLGDYFQKHSDPDDPVMAAMSVAYDILARCIRPDDDQIRYGLLGIKEEAEPISDTQSRLRL